VLLTHKLHIKKSSFIHFSAQRIIWPWRTLPMYNPQGAVLIHYHFLFNILEALKCKSALGSFNCRYCC